jgi:LemA protein
MIPFIVFSLVATGVFFYFLSIFNSIVFLENNIDKSWHNIDVLLRQRGEEIPKLVELVKGYAKYEQETLTKVVEARKNMEETQDMVKKAKESQNISKDLKRIFALAEDYPDLKANENFLELQNRITGIENELADRREFYNESVNLLNAKIESFPDLLIAKLMGKTKKEEYFRAE